MTDIVSKRVRSRMMSGIRGKGNRSTEIRLAKLFRRCGMNGWRRHQPIEGKPDFIFRKKRIAVFVDGCFWHGCPKCYKAPSSNKKFWSAKLKNNKKRDIAVSKKLKQQNWKVIRFWECSLCEEKKIIARIKVIF